MALFADMALPVQFFLAFVTMLGLSGAAVWTARRLGRVDGAGRQQRLAVVDYARVDGRRRLVRVRRDNVEHLVMIGGATDVVVESNIAAASPWAAVAAPKLLAPAPVRANVAESGASRPNEVAGFRQERLTRASKKEDNRPVR